MREYLWRCLFPLSFFRSNQIKLWVDSVPFSFLGAFVGLVGLLSANPASYCMRERGFLLESRNSSWVNCLLPMLGSPLGVGEIDGISLSFCGLRMASASGPLISYSISMRFVMRRGQERRFVLSLYAHNTSTALIPWKSASTAS